MSAIAHPQPMRPIVRRAFGQSQRQGVKEILEGVRELHCLTPTRHTSKKTFPSYNMYVKPDRTRGLATEVSPKNGYDLDLRTCELFIGSNLVRPGSGQPMTFVVAHRGQIGGRLRFLPETLRAIATPNDSEDVPLILNYIEDTQILELLHISVQEGRPLAVLPFRFEGPLPSDSPLLEVGDWILAVHYDDNSGGLLCTLEDRIISRAAV